MRCECEMIKQISSTQCDQCGAYICLCCNFYISRDTVDAILLKKYNNIDNSSLRLKLNKKIFMKHLKTCNNSTVEEKDYDFEFKYCNNCKKKNNKLIDVIHEELILLDLLDTPIKEENFI